MNDVFQMKEQHQTLLERSKPYLIHNVCPTEGFWNALGDILDSEMLEDLKTQQSRSEKVSALVDILPHRGPDAFDGFLVALLKCGHGFVADYLKIQEVADQFKKDIHNYNISEPVQDRIVKTFKKSIPNIQRFFETKLEVNVQEQEMEFQEKEKEIDDLQEQVRSLDEEILDMKSWFKTAVQRITFLGAELQRQYISRSMLREERKYLEEFYEKAANKEKHEKLISDFHDGMHALLDYVAMAEDRAAQLEHAINCGEEKDELGHSGGSTSSGKTITAKVQSVMDLIANVLEKAVSVVKPEEENDVRNELERSISRLKDIIKDLRHVKQIFLLTLRKKEDLSQETLSLVNNFREIRRLEQEMNEQEKHVQDLKKRGQLIKVKSKKHKRQQEQIQESINEKEESLTKLHDSLQKQVSSADQRVHFILSLLPDEEGEDGAHETKTDTSWTPFSRGGTSMTIYPDRSDSRYSLRSDVNDELTATCTSARSVTTPEKSVSHHNCLSPHSPTPAPQPKAKETSARKSPPSPGPRTIQVQEPKDKEPSSARDRSISSAPRSSTSSKGSRSANKGNSVGTAEKVSRETISAAQKRMPPNSPPVSARPRKEILKVSPKGIDPGERSKEPNNAKEPVTKAPPVPQERPPEKPPEKKTVVIIDKNRKEASGKYSPLSRDNSAKYRPSTPDDKKDEKQEKTAANLIKVKPASDENKLRADPNVSKDSKDSAEDAQVQKSSPTVLTKQLSHSKSVVAEKGTTTPRPKYTDHKNLSKGGPLSISSTKAVTQVPPTLKPSVGFDKAFSRPSVSASKSKPIQTQHADLKVETQLMLRDRPGRALKTTRMSSRNPDDHRDAQSSGLPSGRGASNVPDRDSLSQSWMVRSVVTRQQSSNSEAENLVSGTTYPPSSKRSRTTKIDANRLGSNLDNMIKEGKPDSFYGRVTDAINKVKKIEAPLTPSQSSCPNPILGAAGNAFTFQDVNQPRLSLSTESSDGQNGCGDNLASASAISDECSLDNLSINKTWEIHGASAMRSHSISIDGDIDEPQTSQRASSSTSRDAPHKPQ